MEQKTNKQVEAFIFQKNAKGKLLFLIMRRIPGRGGFWQPLTGGIRIGEEINDALLREIQEETKIIKIKRIINTNYTFNFNEQNKNYTEYVYGVEVNPYIEISLSDEHDSYVWVSKKDVLSLLVWPGNIEGFNQLCSILESEKVK